MAIAETAARKLLLHGGGTAVARGVAVGTFSFGLDGLWQLIAGFFADIFGYLLAALAGVAHLLVLPFEVLWQWLAGAAGAIGSGLGGLWHLVTGFFPHLFASLAGAAHHMLVLPFEALWQWLAGSAGAIGSGFSGLWHLVAGFFPHLFAAVAGAAHGLTLHLEAFWRWLQSAAAAALPYALAVAAVLLVVALVWFFGVALCAVTVAVCKAIVIALCYLGHGLYLAGAAVASAVLPSCVQCLGSCAVVTMKAPGAAGMLISRAAFEAAPALYFMILRAGGAVVATAVFCAWPVAWAVAAPVAFLFRTFVPALA